MCGRSALRLLPWRSLSDLRVILGRVSEGPQSGLALGDVPRLKRGCGPADTGRVHPCCPVGSREFLTVLKKVIQDPQIWNEAQ